MDTSWVLCYTLTPFMLFGVQVVRETVDAFGRIDVSNLHPLMRSPPFSSLSTSSVKCILAIRALSWSSRGV